MRLPRKPSVLSRPQSLSRRASPGYNYFADAHHLASLDVIASPALAMEASFRCASFGNEIAFGFASLPLAISEFECGPHGCRDPEKQMKLRE
jgi:hypothetical protein